MNGKPGTRAEVAALAAACELFEETGLPAAPDLRNLYAKLTAPFDRKGGPDLRPVEAVLVAESRGAVIAVPDAGTGWWAGLSRRAADRNVNEDTAAEVGRFLADKPWARGMTIDRVVGGWPSYLARARAEKATPADETGGRTDYTP